MELGEDGKERFDEFEVLLGLNAACGIDEFAAGSQALEVGGKEKTLLGNELFDALGCVTPAGIGTTTENAGVGAREVEEDAVEEI